MEIVLWQFRQSRVGGYGQEGPQIGIVRRQGLKSGYRVGDHPAESRRRPVARRRFGENNQSRVPSDVRTNRRRIPAAFSLRHHPCGFRFNYAAARSFPRTGRRDPLYLAAARPGENSPALRYHKEKGAVRLRAAPPVGHRIVFNQAARSSQEAPPRKSSTTFVNETANSCERTPCGRSAYANRRGQKRGCHTYSKTFPNLFWGKRLKRSISVQMDSCSKSGDVFHIGDSDMCKTSTV